MDSIESFLEALKSRTQHACNILLLRLLASYKVKELVLEEITPFLRFKGTNPSDLLLLPVRPLAVAQPFFPCSQEQIEFYTLFDGLRECPLRELGGFVPLAEVRALEELWDCDLPELTSYRKCPVVFESAGGDVVLLEASGQFSWLTMEEKKAVALAGSFDELLRKYVKHRLVHDGYPFDPYGREG